MTLRKRDADDIIALLEYAKDAIKLINTDGYKKRCYSILAGLMVNFKVQVFIIGIKANMQYSIAMFYQKKKS